MEHRPVDYLVKSNPRLRAVIAGLGLVLVGILWIIAERLTIFRGNQIALFSALVSGVLTLGLVWIYLKIAEETAHQTDLQEQVTAVQSQQADIMERQEELMEIQYLPRARLRDFEILPENKIELTMANVGNGLAEQMFLRTAVFVRPEPDELATHDLEEEAFVVDNQEFTLRPGYTRLVRDEETIVASDLSGEVLRPDEPETTFKSRARLGIEPIHGQEEGYGFTPLSVMLDKIQRKGFDDVHIELSIVYSDIKGTVYTEYVLGRTVGLEAGDRELNDLINTDFVTHWTPMDATERTEMVVDLDIYPPLKP